MRTLKIPANIWLYGSFASLLILLVLLSIPVQSKNLVLQHLNTIQQQMKVLEDTLQKPQSVIEENAISNKITQLSDRIAKIRALSAEEFHRNLQDTEYHLSTQLTAIHEDINHLSSKQNDFVVLDAKYLPFQIISLDSIQEVAVASIAYDFKTIAMEKGDSLAGWTLKSINYGKQKLTFENSKKEQIFITTKEIGGVWC